MLINRDLVNIISRQFKTSFLTLNEYVPVPELLYLFRIVLWFARMCKFSFRLSELILWRPTAPCTFKFVSRDGGYIENLLSCFSTFILTILLFRFLSGCACFKMFETSFWDVYIDRWNQPCKWRANIPQYRSYSYI